MIIRERAPFIIDEGLEGNRKVRVDFAEDHGGEVWLADSDKGLVRVGGLNSAGGVLPSSRAGERGRALRGGGFDDVCDCNSRGTSRMCLRLDSASAPGGVLTRGLIKLRGATMNDISIGVGEGRSTGVLWRIS